MAWHFLPAPEALSRLEYLSLTHINWHAHLQAALTAPQQQTQTTNRACEASKQQRDVLSTLFTVAPLRRGNAMTSSQKQLRSCDPGSALSADPLKHWACCTWPVGCSNACTAHQHCLLGPSIFQLRCPQVLPGAGVVHNHAVLQRSSNPVLCTSTNSYQLHVLKP